MFDAWKVCMLEVNRMELCYSHRLSRNFLNSWSYGITNARSLTEEKVDRDQRNYELMTTDT